ncbi:MAG: hypothetical protein ABJL71_17270 [Cyclobacteriaceae bacterium]
MHDHDEDENLRLSQTFKRAYNDADIILSTFPELANSFNKKEGDFTEYEIGFFSRLHVFFQDQKKERDIREKNKRKNDRGMSL